MSLIAWWPLNGDTKNKGTLGNELEPSVSNITYNDNGKIGKSKHTGSLILTSDQMKKWIGNTVSIAMWIYVRNDGTWTNGIPFFSSASTMTAPNNRKFSMFCYDGSTDGSAKTSLHCSWQHDNSNSTYYNCVHKNFFTIGEWTHLCVVQDASLNKINLYKNGTLISSTNVVDNLNTLSISSVSNTPLLTDLDYLQINDLRIYNHALSAAEVKELSKALVVHYTFDDELATNMLCNEAGYYVKNIANNVEYTTTSAAVGTKSIYCKDGLQRITSLVPQCASDNLTMSVWFKSSNSLPRNNYHIVATIDTGRVEISVPTTGNLRWGGYNTPNRGTAERFCGEASAGLLDNQWHLLTIAYDGTGWLGYVDSVYKGKQTCSGPIAYTDKKLIIGRYYDDATSNYGATNAYIDDLRIYNSVLSPEDIKDLYNCGGRISNLGDALTGEFIEGAERTSVNKNHTITTKEIYEQILPNGYQQLEYIETDGAAYINTTYNSSLPYQINCDMEITGSINGNYWFGQQQNGSRMLYNGFYSNTALEFNWLTVTSSGTRKKMTQTLISDNQVNITINNISYQRDIGINGQGGDLYIFACRTPDNSFRHYGSTMRVYSFTIHQSGIKQREFIPARQINNDALGLYDIINNQFYTNAGSGNFIAGPTLTTGQASMLRAGGLTARQIIEI